METTKTGFIGTTGDIKGLYWDNGKLNGNISRAPQGRLWIMGSLSGSPDELDGHHCSPQVVKIL